MNIFDNIKKNNNATALITENLKKITYSELIKKSNLIASHISSRCLVLIISKNCEEFLYGYLGFLRAKIVSCLINEPVKLFYIENLINNYKPSYAYIPKKYKSFFNPLRTVASLGDYLLIQLNKIKEKTIDDKIALLLGTSGSTGNPKLIKLSYDNIHSNTKSILKFLPIKKNDKTITTLQPAYSYGLSVINTHLYKGATIILNNYSIIEKKFWDLFNYYGVNSIAGVPYTYSILKKLNFLKRKNLKLRYMTQAGGKLSENLVDEFNTFCKKNNLKFFIMYGQTEATARISFLNWNFVDKKKGSIGKSIYKGKMYLVDEKNKKIHRPFVKGEIIYEGPNVMIGYANNYKDLYKNQKNIKKLNTGDIAFKDKENFFYIVGRKNRFTKLFGNRINLADIEKYLVEKKIDSAVIGDDKYLYVFYIEKKNNINIQKIVSENFNINFNYIKLKKIKLFPRDTNRKIMYSKLKHMMG